MSDFTYEIPDSAKYMMVLIAYLKREGEDKLVELLSSAKCSISNTGRFSERRWNANGAVVIFHVPASKYDKLDDYISKDVMPTIIGCCDNVIPKDAGLDVVKVDFVPDFDIEESGKGLEEDLRSIETVLEKTISYFSLPHDVLNKGKEMAEVYLYLYAVENYMRIFIEKVARKSYDTDYFTKLTVPRGVKDNIERRKRQEETNLWLRVRGDSELYYLDFKELGTIIHNNWDIFKSYFPDQAWINSKLDELGNCRNLVAHNSYIGDHERDVIRVNFNSIVRQLNDSMTS